jgi:hypothetical protein
MGAMLFTERKRERTLEGPLERQKRIPLYVGRIHILGRAKSPWKAPQKEPHKTIGGG